MPIQQFIRVNHKIRAREVRVIDSDGKQLGVMPTSQALGAAQQVGLDLVEIAPNAAPPVCKIVEYGKYKYEQEKKERESRKHHHGGKLKEIKLRLNIDDHDYQTKLNHMKEFLADAMKVKVSLFFRGRENAHPELGQQLFQRVIKDMEGYGHAEVPPRQMGKSINMMLSPERGAAKKYEQEFKRDDDDATEPAEASAEK
ncbi:MAG: Translation initiation factor IF-3 [Verrucomicrobiae bacterium]|nr:Translation initiation factor IF-3 [Verrucomicrobiae bacterium]